MMDDPLDDPMAYEELCDKSEELSLLSIVESVDLFKIPTYLCHYLGHTHNRK